MPHEIREVIMYEVVNTEDESRYTLVEDKEVAEQQKREADENEKNRS